MILIYLLTKFQFTYNKRIWFLFTFKFISKRKDFFLFLLKEFIECNFTKKILFDFICKKWFLFIFTRKRMIFYNFICKKKFNWNSIFFKEKNFFYTLLEERLTQLYIQRDLPICLQRNLFSISYWKQNLCDFKKY